MILASASAISNLGTLEDLDRAYVRLSPPGSYLSCRIFLCNEPALRTYFYADVRQDPLIGPIFNAQIKDWNHHLEIIASFWETLIGGQSTYARPMPMKHLQLGLREEDFERWLFLWQANCRAQLPSDVAKEMIDLADHIAHRLRMILGISIHGT
jgi:hemoglobin